jgi:hypothetical protein
LNEFELKRFDFEKSLKKEKKKKKKHLNFLLAQPTAHLSISRSGPPPLSSFLFPAAADTVTPPVGASFSFLPPFPSPVSPTGADQAPGRARSSLLALLSILKSRLMGS